MSENIKKAKDLEGGLQKALDRYHLNLNEADTFLKTAQVILEKNDFCVCAHRIFDLCKELIGATTGYLVLLSNEEAENRALFFESSEHRCTLNSAYPMSITGLKAEAYRLGKTVYENDFSQSKWMKYMPHGHVSLFNVLFTPLNLGKKSIGLIGLANKPVPFTERDAQLFNAFGEIAAIALLNCFIREALQKSEGTFYDRFHTTKNTHFRISIPGGRYEYVSPAFLNITGYSPEEYYNDPLLMKKILHPHWLPYFEEEWTKLLTGNMPSCYEYQIIHKSGESRWLNQHNALIRDKDGAPIAIEGTVSDITDRKRPEEEATNIQKIESIGILAGGIAHDFNNLLTGILGNISLARDIATDNKLLEILKDAELATLRSKNLTQQLLTFSRGGEPIKKLTFLRKFLKDSVESAIKGLNVTYELSIPDGIWSIEIDEGHMSQVIKNLIMNAVQAMPGGGVIHIIVENSSIDDHLLPALKSGDYVKISMQDQGCGIAKENLKKIFDPFFTTKLNQSGLGLSVAYSVIKKHGGYLMAESEVAAGSIFTFYLPALHKEEAEERPVKKAEGSYRKKILFMDDEEMLRKLVNGILTHLGYEVETVSDGAKAIESYKRAKDSGTPFDMVIMDLTVQGGMGGKEAINALLAFDHEAKVIVSSGYAKDPIMAHFKDYGFSGVISKPYDMNKLINVIDTTLNSQTNDSTHKYNLSQ